MTGTEPGDRVVDGVYRALPDPGSDLVLALVLRLAAEVWTLRDRVRLHEVVLARHGIPARELVEQLSQDSAALDEMRSDRDEFLARVLGGLVAQVPDVEPT